LQEQRDQLADELEATRREAMAGKLDDVIASASDVDGVRCATGRIGEASMDDLQALAQQLRDRMGEESVGVLGSIDSEDGKVYVVVSVSDDLVGRGVKAGDIVGVLGRKLGGGGGGRPQLASAGGREIEKLDAVLAEAPDLVRENLS